MGVAEVGGGGGGEEGGHGAGPGEEDAEEDEEGEDGEEAGAAKEEGRHGAVRHAVDSSAGRERVVIDRRRRWRLLPQVQRHHQEAIARCVQGRGRDLLHRLRFR